MGSNEMSALCQKQTLRQGCPRYRLTTYGAEIRPPLVATIKRLPHRKMDTIFPTPGTVSPRVTCQVPLGPSNTAVPFLTSRSVQPAMVVGLVSGTGANFIGSLEVPRIACYRCQRCSASFKNLRIESARRCASVEGLGSSGATATGVSRLVADTASRTNVLEIGRRSPLLEAGI